MTIIAIEQYSDAEKQAYYNSLTEEEKKEGFFCMGYSLDKTWFQWQHFDHPKSCDDFCENITSFISNEPIQGHFKFTIDQFDIPGFMSYNKIDPIIENFKIERKKN